MQAVCSAAAAECFAAVTERIAAAIEQAAWLSAGSPARPWVVLCCLSLALRSDARVLSISPAGAFRGRRTDNGDFYQVVQVLLCLPGEMCKQMCIAVAATHVSPCIREVEGSSRGRARGARCRLLQLDKQQEYKHAHSVPLHRLTPASPNLVAPQRALREPPPAGVFNPVHMQDSGGKGDFIGHAHPLVVRLKPIPCQARARCRCAGGAEGVRGALPERALDI